ncbi:MAG: hypothetical protein PHI94_04125, partial [Eubacteriaceae bacterium]|nr:hypothetical protein [Eubacteriaceae bacterium]
ITKLSGNNRSGFPIKIPSPLPTVQRRPATAPRACWAHRPPGLRGAFFLYPAKKTIYNSHFSGYNALIK